MATSSGIQYKDVKNPNKPGRAPAGCEWVKKGGQLLRNEEGQIAYRPMTAAHRRKKPGGTKPGRPRSAMAPRESGLAPELLMKKRTYKELTYPQLAEVAGIVGELMDRERETERQRLEAELAAVKDKLKQL